MQTPLQSQANPLQSEHFPYPYTVRISKRAQRINLKILAGHGIVLTIPERLKHSAAVAFLEQNIDWVKKHLGERQLITPITTPPDTIHLPPLNYAWQISYQTSLSRRAKLIEHTDNQLLYCGPDEDEPKYQKLRQWLQHKAANFLTQRLQAISEQTQLPFEVVSFRTHKTVWGTCSHTKKISLNHRLIFLPLEFIDYVIIHELAHTKHLNHSDKFWAVVAQHCPHYKQAKNLLKKVEHTIPRWF